MMRYLTPFLMAICLVALLPADAWGQHGCIGIKGGLNVSTLSVNDPADPDLAFDSQTGLVLGGFIQCGTQGWFGLQGEVVYSQNGGKARGGDVSSIDLNYIRVPILLVGRLASLDGPLYPILYAGPQVAFETSCNVKPEDGQSASVGCDSDELDDPLDTNNVEFGLVFGGGVDVVLGGLKGQLDARYNLGLTNLNGGTDASSVSVKNRGWSITVGLGKLF